MTTSGTSIFSLIESLLHANGQYERLELHLDRLRASAAELRFAYDEAAVREQLRRQGQLLDATSAHKVRLLLHQDGRTELGAEKLSVPPEGTPLEVMLAEARLPTGNPLARHKTTRRELFDGHLQAALAVGLHDVLFLNDRGELAEAANSNVFLELGGALLTPSLTCGVLPGVYRRWLLASEPRAAEAVLSEADLHEADAIYLTNSVRGCRRVRLRSGYLNLPTRPAAVEPPTSV